MNTIWIPFQFNHIFPFGISNNTGLQTPGSGSLVISPAQKKLLGVDEADLSFGSAPKFEPQSEKKSKHPFGFAPPLEGSFIASSSPTLMTGHQVSFYLKTYFKLYC